MKSLKKFYKKEEGSILVLVALLMTVLIGMSALVLDLGLAYTYKSNLQKALDSTALAAVRELPAVDTSSAKWTNAKDAAKKYAELNGALNLTDGDIIPVYENNIPSNKIIGIKIKGNTEVIYNFARIFGANSKVLNSSATAKLLTVKGMTGLLPLAMPQAVMDIIEANNLQGQDITLKLGPHKTDGVEDMRADFTAIFDALTNNSGWRGAINFIGTDGDYKKAMENGGYAGMVNIGDIVESSSGTMPVNVEGEIILDKEYTVPVISKNDAGKLVVSGFVTFRVTSLEGNSDGSKKVSILTSSYISNYIASSDSEAGVVSNDYGVRAAKLVD